MVDHYAIAFKEEGTREDYAAAIDGCDWGSGRNAEIEPLVGTLDGAVEDALNAEHIGNIGGNRSLEGGIPFALGAYCLKGLCLYVFIFFNLALIVGAGRGITSWNFQQDARIALVFNADLLFERG